MTSSILNETSYNVREKKRDHRLRSVDALSTVQRMYQLLCVHDPLVLFHLPALLEQYASDEVGLLTRMLKTYGVEQDGSRASTGNHAAVSVPTEEEIRKDRRVTMPLYDIPFRERLERIYATCEPKKLKNLDKIVGLSDGRDDAVIKALVHKYRPLTPSMYGPTDSTAVKDMIQTRANEAAMAVVVKEAEQPMGSSKPKLVVASVGFHTPETSTGPIAVLKMNDKAQRGEPLSNNDVDLSTVQRMYRLLYINDPCAILHLPSLLRQYEGREDQLLTAMERHYQHSTTATSSVHANATQLPTRMPSEKAIRTNRLVTTPLYDIPFHARLQKFFERYDPSQLPKVDGIVKRSTGRENAVIGAFALKYCPEESLVFAKEHLQMDQQEAANEELSPLSLVSVSNDGPDPNPVPLSVAAVPTFTSVQLPPNNPIGERVNEAAPRNPPLDDATSHVSSPSEDPPKAMMLGEEVVAFNGEPDVQPIEVIQPHSSSSVALEVDAVPAMFGSPPKIRWTDTRSKPARSQVRDVDDDVSPGQMLADDFDVWDALSEPQVVGTKSKTATVDWWELQEWKAAHAQPTQVKYDDDSHFHRWDGSQPHDAPYPYDTPLQFDVYDPRPKVFIQPSLFTPSPTYLREIHFTPRGEQSFTDSSIETAEYMINEVAELRQVLQQKDEAITSMDLHIERLTRTLMELQWQSMSTPRARAPSSISPDRYVDSPRVRDFEQGLLGQHYSLHSSRIPHSLPTPGVTAHPLKIYSSSRAAFAARGVLRTPTCHVEFRTDVEPIGSRVSSRARSPPDPLEAIGSRVSSRSGTHSPSRYVNSTTVTMPTVVMPRQLNPLQTIHVDAQRLMGSPSTRRDAIRRSHR